MNPFPLLFAFIHFFHFFWTGTFTGPQIKRLMKSEEFMNSLDAAEKRAWKAAINVTNNFLGNKKAENYEEIVQEMIEAYRDMGVHMSLKIHFFADHLDFFPANLGNFAFIHFKNSDNALGCFKK